MSGEINHESLTAVPFKKKIFLQTKKKNDTAGTNVAMLKGTSGEFSSIDPLLGPGFFTRISQRIPNKTIAPYFLKSLHSEGQKSTNHPTANRRFAWICLMKKPSKQ